MKYSRAVIRVVFFISIIMVGIQSCKKEEPAEGIDKELLTMAEVTTGFVWYKNSDALLAVSAGSGHSEDFLRTRYNSLAATQLTLGGKVLPNASFPEESLVVKELWNSSTELGRYAILYKKSDNPNADTNGWVWGYVNADGTVAASAEDKGASCTGCHSQPDNIDYMLMNKFFP